MGFFEKIAGFFGRIFGGSRKHMKTGAELMKEYPIAKSQTSTASVSADRRVDAPVPKDEPIFRDEPIPVLSEDQVVADDFDDYKKPMSIDTETGGSAEYDQSDTYDPVEDAYNPFSQEVMEKAGTEEEILPEVHDEDDDEAEERDEVVIEQDTGPQPKVSAPFPVTPGETPGGDAESAGENDPMSFKDFGAMKQMLRNQNASEDATRMISLEEIQAEEHVKKSPLQKAIEQHNINVAKILIEKGAYINDKDSDGRSPMDYAIHEELDEIIELLKAQGAE